MITAFILAILITAFALCIAVIGMVFGLLWRLIIWMFDAIITLFRGY